MTQKLACLPAMPVYILWRHHFLFNASKYFSSNFFSLSQFGIHPFLALSQLITFTANRYSDFSNKTLKGNSLLIWVSRCIYQQSGSWWEFAQFSHLIHSVQTFAHFTRITEWERFFKLKHLFLKMNEMVSGQIAEVLDLIKPNISICKLCV